jgi:hypothetical protein
MNDVTTKLTNTFWYPSVYNYSERNIAALAFRIANLLIKKKRRKLIEYIFKSVKSSFFVDEILN